MITKNITTILVIAGFVGITVFGFLAMGDHGTGHNLSGCIAALQGVGCPIFSGLVDFASFHLNAFKAFSSANQNVAAAALTLLIGLFAFYFLRDKLFGLGFYENELAAVKDYSSPRSFYNSFETNFIAWLSLLEKRNAAFLP